MLAQLRKPILTWLIVAGLITFGVVLFTFTPASHTAERSVGKVQSELFIQMQANASTLRVGDEFTYRIRVQNKGPADATGVLVTDTLPENVNFLSASSGCTHSARTVTCNIGRMRRGETAVRRITVLTTVTGKISNTASVRANETDPRPANNTDTVLSNVQERRVETIPPLPVLFSNDQIGISFLVPPGFVVEEGQVTTEISTFRVFNESTGETVGIDIAPDNPKLLNAEAWADAQEWPFNDNWRNHLVVTRINGNEALRNLQTCGVIIFHGERLYRISNGSGYDHCDVNPTAYEGILNSLSF